MTDPKTQITVWGAKHADKLIEISEADRALKREMAEAMSPTPARLAAVTAAAAALTDLADSILLALPTGDERFDDALRSAAMTWKTCAVQLVDLTGSDAEGLRILAAARYREEASGHLGNALTRMREVGFPIPENF